MLLTLLTAAIWQPCPAPRAVDGDGVACGSVRIRLAGIDAPELGRCQRGRACSPGDGVASKASLAAALRLGPVRYQRLATDRYGRLVAAVQAGGVDLSCFQISRGKAVVRYDYQKHVRRTCRGV